MSGPLRETYDQAEYIEWHNANVDKDSNILELVQLFCSQLQVNAKSHLVAAGELLATIRNAAQAEITVKELTALKDTYDIPFKSLSESALPSDYEKLFKSQASILDKLWRKNRACKDNHYIHFKDIEHHIKDLIRTSVVCPSLFHARMFAERLASWKSFILSNPQKYATIARVEVDKEAKLESGYFAYHALIYFDKFQFPLEVQIYSQMTNVWRDMSHIIYEKERTGYKSASEPGKATTRLVSLGHLLHIAECEIERLMTELK